MGRKGQINSDRMFEPLLEADQSLAPVWEDFVKEWDGEQGPLLYRALTMVARHLVGQLASRKTGSFNAVFGVVEQWLLKGDAFVREAATVGLLEDLQNENLHRGTKPADFEPWLRPESLRQWRKVERFWSHGEVITDN